MNRYVRRKRYQSTTPAQAVADIAAESAKIFTKLDAQKGYHQCPLDEACQDLTTFITSFGRYKFLRAPYGISSISEHYNRRMDEAFDGLTGFRRVVTTSLSTTVTPLGIHTTSVNSSRDARKNTSPSTPPNGSSPNRQSLSLVSASHQTATMLTHPSLTLSQTFQPPPTAPTSVHSSD